MANAAKKLPPEMFTETKDLGAEDARDMLQHNVINRPLHQGTVEQYALDMKAGRWELTEDSIAIDADGNLVNGQHRLNGIILANEGATKPIKVRMRITWNAPNIWAVRDRGRIRMVGDFLTWKDGQLIENRKRIVSWIGAVQLFTTRSRMRYAVGRFRDFVEHNEEALRWLDGRSPPLSMRAAVCGALVYAYPVEPNRVDDFFMQYVSGANLEEGSPILALLNKARTRSFFNDSERVQASLATLNAVRAYLREKDLVHVNSSEAGFQYFQDARERMGL